MELLGWSSFRLKVMPLSHSAPHAQPRQHCTALRYKGWGMEEAESLSLGISRTDNINYFNVVTGNQSQHGVGWW